MGHPKESVKERRVHALVGLENLEVKITIANTLNEQCGQTTKRFDQSLKKEE